MKNKKTQNSKNIKIEEKNVKKDYFLNFFEYSSIWGQS